MKIGLLYQYRESPAVVEGGYGCPEIQPSVVNFSYPLALQSSLSEQTEVAIDPWSIPCIINRYVVLPPATILKIMEHDPR